MFCKQCGSEIKSGAAFCSNCGYQVSNAKENVDASALTTGAVCSKCGVPLKDGAAFCNACGASTATDAPAQTEVPYAPTKEWQERVYSFDMSGEGNTYFYLTHNTLVVNKPGTSDVNEITCIPYCVITQILSQKKKIISEMVIAVIVSFVFFLLFMNLDTATCAQGVAEFFGKNQVEKWCIVVGFLFVHGVRIFCALGTLFGLLNCCQTLLIVSCSHNTYEVFYVSAVKKEKEWEKFIEDLSELINMEASEEEIQNNHTILKGKIKKDISASGTELFVYLRDSIRKQKESQNIGPSEK